MYNILSFSFVSSQSTEWFLCLLESLSSARPRSAVSLALTTVETHILVKGSSSSFSLLPVAAACFLPTSVRTFSSSGASIWYCPCRMRMRCLVAVGAAATACAPGSPPASPSSVSFPRAAFGFSRPSQSSIHLDFSRGNCRVRAYCQLVIHFSQNCLPLMHMLLIISSCYVHKCSASLS